MSINRLMARGALWMVGLRLFNRGIGFISTIILARLLVPADFGLVAMATVLMQMLMVVSDFSVHVRLIQKDEIDREDMDSAWSLQFLLGLAQGVILLALAHPAAEFYDEPRLVAVIQLLALIATLDGCRNIGVVMFQREMTFNRDFILNATQKLVMFFITVALALIFRSYWALVGGMLTGTVVRVALSYIMHPHRPRLCRSRWAELIRFSKWLLANNLLRFLAYRGPELVLGRLIGPRAVGLYSVGYEISMIVTTELVAPINRAALPGYSRLRKTEGALRQGYLDVAGLIALAAVPAALGIAATSDVLIPFLLGPKWLDLVPVVHYLAIAGAIASLLTNTGAVFLALGMPWLGTVQLAGHLALLVPGVLIGANHFGVEGVAVAYLLVACLMLFVNLGMLLYVLRLPLAQYLRVVHRPVLSAAAMYALLVAVIMPWLLRQDWAAEWAVVLLAVAAGVALYCLFVLTLWLAEGRPKGAERRVLQILGEWLKPRLPALGRWLLERS